MKVRFTDSLALPVDTSGVDQLTLIPPLKGFYKSEFEAYFDIKHRQMTWQ